MPSSVCINDLNTDCFLDIFAHLNYYQLLNCRLVCRKWLQLIDKHLLHLASFNYGRMYNRPNDCKAEYRRVDVLDMRRLCTILQTIPNLTRLKLAEGNTIFN